MKILEPELVPIQFWRRRSHPLTSSGWGEVRKQELARTGNKCEYCGTKYDKGLIIHHEYEFKVEQRDKINSDGSIDTTIQRYVSGYAVSCKYCNLVLHWQFASGIGRSNFAVQHLMKIRNMTEEQARNLILEKVTIKDKYKSTKNPLDLPGGLNCLRPKAFKSTSSS